MGPKVVALCGLAQSGKSTCADYLERMGYRRIKFASPLKDMLRALGLDEEHLEGELKEKPCDLLLGHTPRHAMQTLGTEWGRALIGQDLWRNIWSHRVMTALAQGINVVVDDLRHLNELEEVRNFPSVSIKVVRPGVGSAGTHSSEQYHLDTDFVIFNHGTKQYLWETLESLV